VAAVFERYVEEPAHAPLTWRAADPLFRPTIMLSGLAPESRIAGHFEGDRSSVVDGHAAVPTCVRQPSAVLHKMCIAGGPPEENLLL
jgi:hypothetical protein